MIKETRIGLFSPFFERGRLSRGYDFSPFYIFLFLFRSFSSSPLHSLYN